MITSIPFQGFYDSVHSYNLDDTLEQMAQDDQGEIDQETAEKLHSSFSRSDELLVEYCKLYVNAFNKKFELDLIFESFDSPREYNFDTDRIFCEISEDELLRIYDESDKEELNDLIKKRFTSYDGFSSFYDSSLDKWPKNILEWDHNQISTLLELIADDDFELYSMDDTSNEGDLNNIVYNSLSKEAKLIIDIHNESI